MIIIFFQNLAKAIDVYGYYDKVLLVGDFKDTHREKAPSNKTPSLTKRKNMDIWFVGTPDIRGSSTETKFSKK